MLVINQGMQQRLSNSWKLLGGNTDYEEDMADEGDGSGITNTSSSSPTSNGAISSIANGNSGPGSIVNSLLLKKTGAFFGDSPGAGLEQKIKELKADKEAGEVKKCPGSLNDQDSPLDFSVKRRSSFSGSLTDDSQGSSCSPPIAGEYRGMSPTQTDFSNTINNSDSHNGDVKPIVSEVDNYFEDQKPEIGQPKVSVPPINNLPSLLNGMGMLPGMPSNLLTNGSAINNFSQVISAATKMNEHRNRKNSRPFKAYPKEALQLPLGFLGMPGFAALQQGLESGIFAGMSSDEIMSLYNQQLQLFRDKQLSTSAGKNSPPSQISSTTPSINNINGHQHLNSHSVNQQSPPHPAKHQVNSPGLVPTSPLSNLSQGQNSPPHFPPHHHISPDHLKSNGLTPSPTITNNNPFPAPHPPHPASSSIHASTLVSSTSSSFGHGQSSNARKRPRSLPDDQKDDAYWERRRKNNDAAKRSRDARRAKEDEIALRAALLEQENLKLRVEVAALKTETARLRCMLYNT